MKTLPQYCENLRKKTARTLYKKNLLSEGDNILIGLSGGKDSLVLADILSLQLKHLPFNVKLSAAHIIIEEVGYKTDLDFLSNFCKKRSIEFHIKKAKITEPSNRLNKNLCFICSWTRRKELFQLTKDYSYNKLAFGHNMDDAIETTLLNMIHHGSISSIPYKLNMFNGRVEIIRPLLEFTNQKIKEYSNLRSFPEEIKRCIHGESSSRKGVNDILKYMEELNKDAKKNIFRAIGNQYPEYLPK